MTALARSLSYVGRAAARIVLPSPCISCERALPWRDRCCSCCGECWRAMPRLAGDACIRCSFSRRRSGEFPRSLCIECIARREDPLERIRAWGPYTGPLEAAIQAMKYRGHHFLAAPLADLLLEAWCAGFSTGVDVVIPVPLHPSRRRERGFNQAELLARAFGRRAGVDVEPALLRKVRPTPPQTRRSREERLAGLGRVFLAPSDLRGAEVLLVDDVCTTGATLRACAKALRRGGAGSIRAVVLARA